MGGLSLGRVFGVQIILNWTVVVIFALITFQLGAVVFPAWHPAWSAWLSWSVALGAATVFFLSILIHELSHALVGRAYKIPVRSITLFIFGGMANIERRPPHARAELLMAIVGPVTSLVLGFGFVALTAALSGGALVESSDPLAAAAAMGPLATLLAWVGPLNILLAIFNMVPAFPLDGGRVLRAILWWSTGDLAKATRWAAGLGQIIAGVLIATGILMAFGVWIPIFGTGFVPGLWLALIGWFLYGAAQVGRQEVLVERMLNDVHVRDLMARDLVTVPPGLAVRELVEEFYMRTDQHAFPVVTNGNFVGIVCAEDIRAVPRDAWDSRRVQDIMTPRKEIETVAPDDEALASLRKLGRRDVSQLPVIEGTALRGLLRRRDITRWLELQAAG